MSNFDEEHRMMPFGKKSTGSTKLTALLVLTGVLAGAGCDPSAGKTADTEAAAGAAPAAGQRVTLTTDLEKASYSMGNTKRWKTQGLREAYEFRNRHQRDLRCRHGICDVCCVSSQRPDADHANRDKSRNACGLSQALCFPTFRVAHVCCCPP